MTNESLQRSASLGDRIRASVDGTYTFSLSSEEPYRRYDGDEVLVHSPAAVDMKFLKSGNAPLLDSHNWHDGLRNQLGVIIDAWLEEKRLYVTVKFSNRAEAQAIRQDVDDGIIRNVSVGYDVHKTERDDDADSYRVTKWTPKEASFVSIPADTTVGMGRAATKEGQMDPIVQTTPSGGTMPGVRTDEQRAAALESAVNEISTLASTHNMGDLARAFIQGAMTRGDEPSLAVFKGLVRAKLPENTPLVNEDIGLSGTQTLQFSVLRLARAMADGASRADIEAASFEIEAAGAARTKADAEGRKTSGTYTLPSELMNSWGDFEVDGVRSRSAAVRAAIGTAAGGANILDTSHLADRFIDNLRNASSVMRAGATMLTGLDNNVEIPGGQANNAAAWLGSEDANVAESNPTFRKITLAPKDLGSFTDLTRRMLQQSTIALEQYVRKQITDGIVLEIDRAAMYGTGATGQPTGLNATAGIGSVAFATTLSTGIPTREELIDMRKLIAVTNRGTESLQWIINSSSLGDMQKTRVDAGSGMFLIQDSNERLIGNPFIESNQIPVGPTLNDIWLGYWADMLIGMWGSLDLDRDTAAKFLSGGIRLRGIQTVDVAVQRVGSFARGT